jgi:dihydrofolate synthase/folylpolyglutamate synthase
MGFYPRTHAVFGVMAHKDIDAIYTRMAPLVDHWHVTICRSRAASAGQLAARHAPSRCRGRR